ncbi:chloride channel protein, CIC family [Amphibacillus marinus]|uniref:Chloride channel protein, CIC family n=1 Tax=Amphibacillus marinus TaxID=872970 RepID=A0A1H8LQQ6_9BACI|nr:chloride channel protein [Amphibacillus marinus]SEO07188.1 chloride channel protein, CIC family [Amphibacillus marinus]
MFKLTKYTNLFMWKWMFLATIVGIGGGVSALILNATIDLFAVVGRQVPLWIAPVIGGVCITIFARIDKNVLGSGSPKYIDAVNLNQGNMSRRTWLAKLVASASTIGFFGSGGVEGPMLLMGGSFANILTKLPKLSNWLDKEDKRILTICGAAGAIGAIFRSPLGGGIFAAEILYKSSLHYSDMFPAILSSTVGFVVYSTIGTATPLFAMSNYLTNPANILYYVLAGVLAGWASVSFMKLFHWLEDFGAWLAKYGLGKYLPIIGGMLTGAILLFFPDAGGTGTAFIQSLIDQSFMTSFLLALLFAKMLATAFTVGLRGSAGLVIPALFIGAVTGSILSNLFATGANGLSNALIISGMAASLASIANVPIAAAVMLIEMVGLQVGASAVVGSVMGYAVGHKQMIYINMSHNEPDYRAAKDFRKLDRYFD